MSHVYIIYALATSQMWMAVSFLTAGWHAAAAGAIGVLWAVLALILKVQEQQ